MTESQAASLSVTPWGILFLIALSFLACMTFYLSFPFFLPFAKTLGRIWLIWWNKCVMIQKVRASPASLSLSSRCLSLCSFSFCLFSNHLLIVFRKKECLIWVLCIMAITEKSLCLLSSSTAFCVFTVFLRIFVKTFKRGIVFLKIKRVIL